MVLFGRDGFSVGLVGGIELEEKGEIGDRERKEEGLDVCLNVVGGLGREFCEERRLVYEFVI